MSSKTIIQGIDPVGMTGNAMPGNTQSIYSRNAQPGGGTVVPGMMENMGGEPVNVPAGQKPVKGNKPVKGFLYTVSRTAAGEYWPLHLGQNTIGTDPSCDIVLKEGTVSSQHAVLMVRNMKNPAKVIASITDARSTNGTMLNGESLAFSDVECHNGDIITIGDNYELYLILVDPATLGLKVCDNFIAIEDDEDDDLPPFPGMPSNPGYNPYASNIENGTVGLDGSTPGNNHGGTIGM